MKELSKDREHRKKKPQILYGHNCIGCELSTLELPHEEVVAGQVPFSSKGMLGREQQIERVIQNLSKLTKNNPCILGENGVKRADIAEGLAQRIVAGEVPETMAEKHVIALDVAHFLADIKYSRECEERARKLISEMKEDNDVILFVDVIRVKTFCKNVTKMKGFLGSQKATPNKAKVLGDVEEILSESQDDSDEDWAA